MAKVSAVAIGQNLPLIRWFLAHSVDINALVTDIEDITTATGYDAKWAAIKAAGDLIIKDMADFPGLPTMGTVACTQGEADQLVGAHGEIIGKILQNLPAIMAFIMQILPLFGGGAAKP